MGRQTLPFHYGWVIIAVGFLVIFSCIGLARYAYTMLLPSMQSSMGLPYDRMGLIGTANFIGYLGAVIAAPLVLKRFHPRTTISLALAGLGCCMLLMGQSTSYSLILLLYCLVGIGTGFANIPLMAMVSWWFRSDRRGRAAGLIIGSSGAAIISAGHLIPLLNNRYGPQGWRISWMLIGAVALAVALITALLLRNRPVDVGQEPMGNAPPPSAAITGTTPELHHYRSLLIRLGLLYLAFGATFMVYGTFIVTTMVREYGFSEIQAGRYWSLVGVFSLFSGVVFGTLSDYIGRRQGLALVFTVQSAAYLLAAVNTGSPLLTTCSVVLYGSAVFAIPAIMAAAVGDYLGPAKSAAAFSLITIFFAVGQTIGPAASGIIAAHSGTFRTVYGIAALITILAALFTHTLPPPEST